MDILLQVAVFLVIFGLGKLIVARKTGTRLHEVQRERDQAMRRLKELSDGPR